MNYLTVAYNINKDINATFYYKENLWTGFCSLCFGKKKFEKLCFECHVNFKTTAFVISVY